MCIRDRLKGWITPDELETLVGDFMDGATKGMIFNGEYIALGEKDAINAMLEQGDIMLGTVWMHETGHALDNLAMKEGEIDSWAKNLQEYLTNNIGNYLKDKLKPQGIAVVLKARHLCQEMRGVKKRGEMVTSLVSGVFKEDNIAREEFLELCKNQ